MIGRIVPLVAVIASAAVASGPKTPVAPSVALQRLPAGAIQPQAAVDAKGVVHLVYFQGPPEAGDLYYVHFPALSGLSSASAPIKVNSKPGTVTAMGTIRSEQIALGPGGRVHVIWNGLAPKEGKPYAPMYAAYTRLDDSGTAFEPQRNLCQFTGNLDGGDSIAADGQGNVYATWHTAAPGNTGGEGGRGVWCAVSRDNGKSFARERLINPEPTGACACCSMRAFVEPSGVVRVIYRAAREKGTQRDTMLLTSTDHGSSFTSHYLDPWPLNACPMSSFSLAESESTLVAAWETRERVLFSPLDATDKPARTPIVAPGVDKSKHPVVVANSSGQVLFAWTEDTGWARGGSLSWQVYERSGQPLGPRGHAAGVPAWSLLSAYARPDGGFVILH